MNTLTSSELRDTVSASSAGGAPFLLSYGGTLLACGIAWLYLPAKVAALAVMFQGSLALPVAFWLESRMRWATMPADHSLRSLSIQLAMSQILALPVVMLIYQLNPNGVPMAMAAIAGAHFLPYVWLQRTPVYGVLAVAVSIGALAIQATLGKAAPPYVLFFMTACYWIAAPLVRANARRLTAGLSDCVTA